MSYNGWKNWQTWNVALWLGNDEGLYRAAVELKKRARPRVRAIHAETFVRDLMPDGTPDMVGKFPPGRDVYQGVAWGAIAADIRDL